MKIAPMEVTLLDHCGTDLSVVNAARVSFHKESFLINVWDDEIMESVPQLSPQDTKLINYLAKHKHTSPFNHAFISVRVKAPIFVARQLVKHKFLPWNEVSRRYVDEEPEFYFPDVWRAKAENVKQGSSEEAVIKFSPVIWKGLLGDSSVSTPMNVFTQQQVDTMLFVYNGLLKDGVCPEQARMILPQNTMTEWVWSGTLGAFADMLRLRLDSHTQQETREVAQKVYQLILPLFPVSLPALLEN